MVSPVGHICRYHGFSLKRLPLLPLPPPGIIATSVLSRFCFQISNMAIPSLLQRKKQGENALPIQDKSALRCCSVQSLCEEGGRREEGVPCHVRSRSPFTFVNHPSPVGRQSERRAGGLSPIQFTRDPRERGRRRDTQRSLGCLRVEYRREVGEFRQKF